MRPGPLNRKLATFRSNSCILNLARHQAPPQLVRPRMCRSFLFRLRVKILKYLILAFLPWRGFRAQRGETLQPVRIGRKLAPQLGRSIYLFRSCPVPSRTPDENAGADESTMSSRVNRLLYLLLASHATIALVWSPAAVLGRVGCSFQCLC